MVKWYVSHPSGGIEHTPTFFRAIEVFAATQPDIELIMPKLEAGRPQLTRDDILSADLVLVEVSVASTGSGIELGWAHAAGKRIVAFHEVTATISPAVPLVAGAIFSYLTEEDVTKILTSLLP